MHQHPLARSLASAGLVTLLGMSAQPLLAAPEFDRLKVSSATAADKGARTNEARQKAYDHTRSLMALQKRWGQAKGNAKAQVLQQMQAKAEQRRAFLLELMQTDPAAVANAAIPDARQLGMPTEVLQQLEQKVELQGELEVFYEDREDGSHRLRHFLKTPFGERFELHLATRQPELKHGHQVRLQGALVTNPQASTDGDIALESAPLVLAADGGDTGGSNGGTAASGSATFGAQSTLVINVNFADNRTEPWTQEQARSTVFDQASDFIQENAFGQTWLTGDVTPWLNLPINGAGCDTSAIVDAATRAATGAGYNLSQYNRLIFAMPSTSGCGFSGVGSVGGTTSTMLINGSMYWFTVAHEMGHNLGLYHSHALECGSEVMGSNCSSDEYGDGVDIMGRVSGHFTAFQKERLGWLDSRHILTVNSSGIHELEPYAGLPGTAPKALKIAKGIDPASGEQSWFYVEYRQASGYDSILAGSANVQNGVVVHTGIDNKGNSSFMLDMTPGSKSSSYTDTRDPALEVGYQFSDADSGVTLATEWVDGSRARVNVQLDGSIAACTETQPVLDITPGTTVWTQSGSRQNYTLTLTNRNDSACSSVEYMLNTSLPTGWTSALASNRVTLASGESRSLGWDVTTAETAIDGYYTLNAVATSGNLQAQDSVTLVIDNPIANSAPDALSDTASTPFETPVTIDVLANDSDPDGDALQVTTVNAINGSALINADGSITYTPATGFSGMTSFSYGISDGQGGSDSASISVEVAPAPQPEPEPNRAPVALNDSAGTAFETAVDIAVLNNDYDPEGDSLQVTAASTGNGSASINADGTIRFTPASGFSGTASLSYTIRDAQGATATALVSIRVEAAPEPTPEPTVNAAPVATDDSASMDTLASITIPVLNNDRDPEGSALRIISATQGSKGSVRLNANGTLTYTPGKPFKLDDSFSYTITDGEKTATARVYVQLNSSDSSGSKGKGNSK